MEFLRFGSSIPGSYWGCCAVDVIQNFNYSPDAKGSIQLVDGDGGNPLTNSKGFMFAGPTYRDIFHQRLRYGTFGTGDMPNHGFIAILTANQVRSSTGKQWLAILKEAGFEFIRTVDNSVYSGSGVITKPGAGSGSGHENYIFGLFRNVGRGAVEDPYTPPKEWTDLPSVVPEVCNNLSINGADLSLKMQEAQLPLYNALPKGKFLSEAELEKDGIPITYAGLRSKFPQQLKSARVTAVEQANKTAGAKTSVAPFAVSEPSVDAADYDDIDDYDDAFEDYDCGLCDSL